MNDVLRIAVVAASPLVRAGLRVALAEQGGFEVVGAFAAWPGAGDKSFGSAQVVVAAADAWSAADVDDSGPACVLLASERDLGQLVADALSAGCSVVPADAAVEAIAAAAHAAASGLVSSTPALLASSLRQHSVATGEAPLEPLTPREREVLRHLSQGLGNKAIGESLHISPHTAKFHVGQIIAKLDAGSRAGAVVKAVRAGLVEL